MLGCAAGGAVRLASAGEMLMVAEGVETAAAAMTATIQPTWAALSTSGMVALILPPIVGTVIILADNDINGAGERAAYVAAQRWIAEGRRVRIVMPPQPGTNFNDVVVGRYCASIMEARDVAA
jgi:putative DNA primase/helicase